MRMTNWIKQGREKDQKDIKHILTLEDICNYRVSRAVENLNFFSLEG